MNYKLLSEQVENHVQSLFRKENNPFLLYHNLAHTEYVATAATQIANHYGLNDKDFFVVISSAWFHDVGYLKGADGHEIRGGQEAFDYLAMLKVDKATCEAVRHCVLATKMPQNPQNLCEQIVCDADMFHLGADTDEFMEKSKLLRKEFAESRGIDFNKKEWRTETIKMMQAHHYHTDYGRQLLDTRKQENLSVLLEKQKDKEPEKNEAAATTPIPFAQAAEKDKKKNDDKSDKGIQTMFRISSSNHQRLSDMADNKSHIMITVNSIIISVVVSLLLRKLDTNDHLIIPAIALLMVSLATIVLSILATRPTIPGGTFTQQDIDDKKVNLLFFGNFYKMSLESYSQGMKEVMADNEFLYSNLIRDVYSQGVVLGRKYKLLRAAYNVFMFGLIISVAGFIIAALTNTFIIV